jgi:hypothetical protein
VTGNAYLRDASELIYPNVAETIGALGLLGQDSAAVKLAQQYARAIDAASPAKYTDVLRWLGPELLKVLESLGATPAARAALEKGVKAQNDAPSGLQKLRAAR